MSKLNWDEVMRDSNYENYYKEWLIKVAPDFLWYNVQDVGSYQGQIYGVAEYQKKAAIYEDYYGSCSGCGAWGEGGEPADQAEVIQKCTFFDKLTDALEYIAKLDSYESPDKDELIKAVKEILLAERSEAQ